MGSRDSFGNYFFPCLCLSLQASRQCFLIAKKCKKNHDGFLRLFISQEDRTRFHSRASVDCHIQSRLILDSVFPVPTAINYCYHYAVLGGFLLAEVLYTYATKSLVSSSAKYCWNYLAFREQFVLVMQKFPLSILGYHSCWFFLYPCNLHLLCYNDPNGQYPSSDFERYR